MKKLSDEAIFILALLVMFLLALIIRGMIGVIDHTEKTDLKGHTEVLVVGSIKYTKPTQTNVQDTQKQENRLCGLAVVECENEKVCNLDEVSCLIKEVAEEYGIDWKIAVSISKWETGNYTSDNYLYKHNVGGTCYLGVVMTFSTLEEGIDYFISNLKRNYFDKELTTLELIQPIYCPIGAKNDPNNLNIHWLSGTKRIYESLEV